MVSANESSAIDLGPWKEQLLSKVLKDEMVLEKTDEMTPSYTQCSGTLGMFAETENCDCSSLLLSSLQGS